LSSLLKISVSLLTVLISSTTSAGVLYRSTAGAGEAGIGYTSVMKDGFWSSFHNPAFLGTSSSLSFGLNYQDRFGIKELADRSLAVIVPAGNSSVGIIYSHFGYSDFKRDKTGLASGIKLSERMLAGIQIDYFSERLIGDYKNTQYLSFETGLLIHLSGNIQLGILLCNPVPNSLRKKTMPATLRVGTSVFLNRELFAGIEADISTESSLIIRTGFDYKASKQVSVRGGFISETNSFCFGLGYLMSFVQLDIGFITHEKLGTSSSVSLIFKLNK